MKRNSLIASLASIVLVVVIAGGFLAAGARPQLGLDLQGGISAALRPDPDAANQPEDLERALDVAVSLIRQRVDSLGVAEPDIARQGDDTIIVQLPGITDPERARQVIGQTAQLGFYPVERLVVPGTEEYVATPACMIPDVDEGGEPRVDADGEAVYVLNPDRPSPGNPVDGVRYVCGEPPSDEPVERDPIDTGPSERVQDLITDPPTDSTDPPTDSTESPTDGATEPDTTESPADGTTDSAPADPASDAPASDAATDVGEPTPEPSGDAMVYRPADASEPSEAPSPATDEPSEPSEAPTDPATDTPTGIPTDLPEPVDDGLPEDAPRPLKYVVGDPPTDQPAPLAEVTDAPADETDEPTDAATDGTDAPTDAATDGTDDATDPATDAAGDPLSGDDIVDASPTVSGTGWVVQLDLDSDGGEAFRLATADLACQRDAGAIGQLAIVLDDVVRSAPNMSEGVLCGQGIAGGSATITVGEDDPERAQEEAQNLALVLDVGALPLTLTEATFDTVSPSLGSASLRNGLIAGLIGLLLVGIYLTFFYRALGLIAIGGLGIFGVLVIGTITLMGQAGFALTLAGVAGIVVAIGITADSSIIFFERIRDEVALGKTMRTAVSRGFKSAFRTNLAGNTVTLSAALILYFLAVGPVRGFAFTLGLATILDIVILWAYSRSVVGLLAGSRRITADSVRTTGRRGKATAGGTA